jgi:hypothetical protein
VGETASWENRSHCGHGYLLWYSMWQCLPNFQHRTSRFRSQKRDVLKSLQKAAFVFYRFRRTSVGMHGRL